MLNVWETWFLYLVIYSFIGWAYESTVCSVAERKLVNRGFLNGPVCPIYGVGAVAVIALLNPLKDNILALFFSSATLTTTLEYVTSWLMETLLHARWWDYSNRFLNLHGRVCLKGFVVFGALSVLMLRFVHPLVEGLVTHLPAPALHPICLTLLIILLADIFVTLKAVLHLPERLRQLKLALDARLPDIHWPDGFQLKRLMNAFPHLTFPRYPEQWKALLRHYGRRISLPARKRGAKKGGPSETEPAKKED